MTTRATIGVYPMRQESDVAITRALEIVRLLAAEELDVTTLATRLGLSVANASQHLSRLRAAGMFSSR
jgi:DNA-binding transcriptional ArsR family regulator